MVDQMFPILTTFTEESQGAILARCSDLKFNPDSGAVPLRESFINLGAARDILIDAIEHQKLIQLPITIQSMLLKNLSEISRAQASLLGGTDEVVNLVAAIEQLNTSIWQFGLHNLSPEVLGYQRKMNQLKNEELQLKKLADQLTNTIALKSEFDAVLDASRKERDALASDRASADAQAKAITEMAAKSTETEQKLAATLASAETSTATALSAADQKFATALSTAEQKMDAQVSALEKKAATTLATIEQTDRNATQLLAKTNASNAEVLAIEPKIKEFFTEIASARQTLEDLKKLSETTVTTNKARAEQVIAAHDAEASALIAKLKQLEDQIGDQINKATGFSLFHSFQTRQEALRASSRFWMKALAGALFVALLMGGYLIYELRNAPVNGIFFLRLALSVPLFYAVGFCTVQYGRERRLEEEYAFKANISISLDPYQQLVHKLVKEDNPAEWEKYTLFIIDSITKVFTSPTEKIFESPEKEKAGPKLSNKTLKQIFELMGAFLKEIKH